MNSGLQPRYSPYPGLIPYTEEDTAFFFGREKETRLIIANLFASPLTVLYGPSGVGKSSVLRAGVVSQLAQRDDLRIIYNSDWKDDPLDRLKSLLGTLPGLEPAPNTDLSLSEFLGECVARVNNRMMIVLDQFEEYFLYHTAVDEFTVQFSHAVMQQNAPVSFLISIREDALAKLDRFEGRIPILFDNFLRLEHLEDTAARSAIEKPIDKYNELNLQGKEAVQIESGLVDEVLNQLKSGHVTIQRTGLGLVDRGVSGTIETPYLQLVMTRLWEQKTQTAGPPVLRLATLRKLGGAEKIVRTHLDAVMRRLTASQRGLASKIFQYLVTPSGTKIALPVRDLVSYAGSSPEKVQALLQRLTRQDVRLLRAVESIDINERCFEIFHDVLAWPILDWRRRYLRNKRFIQLTAPVLTFLLCSICSFSMFREPGKISYAITFIAVAAFLLILGFITGRYWGRES